MLRLMHDNPHLQHIVNKICRVKFRVKNIPKNLDRILHHTVQCIFKIYAKYMSEVDENKK